MFEQTSRLAEKVATSVSRRRFLGSLGRWAAVTAVGLAGFLTGGPARGGEGKGGGDKKACCTYQISNNVLTVDGKCEDNPCPPTLNGFPLLTCLDGACLPSP